MIAEEDGRTASPQQDGEALDAEIVGPDETQPVSQPSPNATEGRGLPAWANELAERIACGEDLDSVISSLAIPRTKALELVAGGEFIALLDSKIPSITFVKTELEREARASIKKIARLRDSAVSEKVQLAAAKDLADRAGLTPVRKVLQVSYTIQNPKAALAKKTIQEVTGR
jgi:hypothetical protein